MQIICFLLPQLHSRNTGILYTLRSYSSLYKSRFWEIKCLSGSGYFKKLLPPFCCFEDQPYLFPLSSVVTSTGIMIMGISPKPIHLFSIGTLTKSNVLVKSKWEKLQVKCKVACYMRAELNLFSYFRILYFYCLLLWPYFIFTLVHLMAKFLVWLSTCNLESRVWSLFFWSVRVVSFSH